MLSKESERASKEWNTCKDIDRMYEWAKFAGLSKVVDILRRDWDWYMYFQRPHGSWNRSKIDMRMCDYVRAYIDLKDVIAGIEKHYSEDR